MTTLQPFEKLIITRMKERTNVRVIGIKPEEDGSTTYAIESLRVDFTQHRTGSKIMRLNSKEIDSQIVNIERH